MKKLVLIVIVAALTSCGVMAPFSETPQKNVPQDTKAITTNAQLQDVKSAFVEKGIVLEQNSESEFKTEPMNLTPFAVIYYQAMKNGDGTKIVAIDKREYKSFRVGVDDVLSDQHHEKIWGLVADIMDRNNLAYEFK